MLTQNEIAQIKDALTTSKKPYFYFHDDPDGLASYLLFYRYIKEGQGFVVKARPHITNTFVERVKHYGADRVFVLDIANVDQEFIDQVKIPVIWIDHHTPQQPQNVAYYNPRAKPNGQNIPTPVLCYQVVQQDLWLATIGSIGDWYFPPFAKEFTQQYPDILPPNVKTIPDAMLNTKAGEIIKLFSFILKGESRKVTNNIHALATINDPYELLEPKTKAGIQLKKHYDLVNTYYEQLKEQALKNLKEQDPLIVFTYQEDQLSLTKDLANEFIARYPNKIIIFGREKEGEYRCSLRSGSQIQLHDLMTKAFEGIRATGGGHEHACGAAIQKEDFQQFIQNLRKLLQ